MYFIDIFLKLQFVCVHVDILSPYLALSFPSETMQLLYLMMEMF